MKTYILLLSILIKSLSLFAENHPQSGSFQKLKKSDKTPSGISIPEQLKGNWISTEGSNEWRLGIYDSLAVADNEFYHYKNISVKKGSVTVVLRNSDGKQRQIKIRVRSKNLGIIKTESGKEEILKKIPTKKLACNSDEKLDFSSYYYTRPARIQGYLNGYDAKSGITTGLIYNSNEIVREDLPTVVTIYPNGYFTADLSLFCPKNLSIELCNQYIPFYIEPGKTLTLYLDWQEITAKSHADDDSSLKETLFMGPDAFTNRCLSLAYDRFKPDYSTFRNDILTFTPDAYGIKRYHTWLDMRHFLDSLISTGQLSDKAAHLLKNRISIDYAVDLFNFVSNRNYYASQNPENEIIRINENDNYYGFLQQLPLNDISILSDENFNTFINRLEFMNPFKIEYRGGSFDVSEFDERMSWNIKDEWSQMSAIFSRLTRYNPRNLCFNLILTRNFSSSIQSMRRAGIAERLLPELNELISPEFFKNEVYRIYCETFPKKKASPFDLPKGIAADIFKKITEPYKGKNILIDFWGIYCGPCRMGIENSRKMRDKLKDNDRVKFIFITDESGSPQKLYEEYVAENMPNDISVRLSDDDFHHMRELFRFAGIPRYVSVDSEGVISNNLPGYETFFMNLYDIGILELSDI